jgi:hypothetical protein
MMRFFLFATNFVDNMATVKTQENINSQVCWQKGTFSHDVLDPYGNVLFVSAGDYGIKWKKQDDGKWKIFHADFN